MLSSLAGLSSDALGYVSGFRIRRSSIIVFVSRSTYASYAEMDGYALDKSALHVLRAGLGQPAASVVRDDGKGLMEQLPDDIRSPDQWIPWFWRLAPC